MTFLYLAYILGWALIDPKIAPKLPPEQYRLPVPAWLRGMERPGSGRVVAGTFGAAW